MKRPLHEQEQTAKPRTRFRMLQHAQKISHNVSQTCRFFGISRAQYYIWLRRFEKNGMEGLRDRPRRPSMIRYRIPSEVIAPILRIREERRYGAVRTSLYLPANVMTMEDLQDGRRRDVDLVVALVSLKRYRHGPRRQAEGLLPVPGQSVQVDVKFVPRLGRARQRFYQFTTIDEATRYRLLRVYDHNNTRSAVAFLDEVRRRLPFAIRRIQTDNDSSFGPQFT